MAGNAEETVGRTPVDPGTPPAAVEQALNRLYSKNRRTVPSPEVEEAAPPESHSAPQPMVYKAPAPSPAAVLSTEEMKVIDTLRHAASSLTIFVNDVELSLDVVGVHRTEESICCLVKKAGLRCKIPRSESVRIELEGESIETAFLGSWHTIDWLGVHIVVFPVLPPLQTLSPEAT